MAKSQRKKLVYVLSIIGILVLGYFAWIDILGGPDYIWYLANEASIRIRGTSFSGSKSCKECHTVFHEKWSTSWHGLAMQPITGTFARTKVLPQTSAISIGKRAYKAEFAGEKGWVSEKEGSTEKRYPIEQIMGGKNVYYFLTTLERGHLQVLPVGYDTRRKEWFDIPGSAIRHSHGFIDSALHWTDRAYTFNTSCYRCHVSQLVSHYDVESDSYSTVWKEPGINCETCHGPGYEHIKACKLAGKHRVPADLKTIITRKLTTRQRNEMCANCHVKMMPITRSFIPGERLFDHYDIGTLEDPDFYPDGRELGEDFTYTTWLTSPCVKSGKLDCMHCHTSSGRYRFHGDSANNACMPCHMDKVADMFTHAHHADTVKQLRCVGCHMPMTEFGRMRRSDHSIRPPTPAASRLYGSPTACTICHTDRSAAWADTCVRQWHADDYQAPYLYRARLIDEARRQDWTRLEDMIAYIHDKDRDEVFATSLIRLLRSCTDRRIQPMMIKALSDPSPLVRSSAAAVLDNEFTPQSVAALLTALNDDFRLVRIRAAGALAGVPKPLLPDGAAYVAVQNAQNEFVAAMQSQPDSYRAMNILGNFYMSCGEFDRAIRTFEVAKKIQPEMAEIWANAALAYNMVGKRKITERYLRTALSLDSSNAALHLNVGLFLGEEQRFSEAADEYRAALAGDSTLVVAAYNLGVVSARLGNLDDAIRYCRMAATREPQEAKYGYAAAFYLQQAGKLGEAVALLETILTAHPDDSLAHGLHADIRRQQGKSP